MALWVTTQSKVRWSAQERYLMCELIGSLIACTTLPYLIWGRRGNLGALVVAFAGTSMDDIVEWMANLDFKKEDFPYDGCEVRIKAGLQERSIRKSKICDHKINYSVKEMFARWKRTTLNLRKVFLPYIAACCLPDSLL
jgi:hypothetical protein